ncbi:MAG: restriction endonuclease subunit S, partial [Planctomycetia bacterium]
MSFPKYPKYKASGVEWLGDVPEHWRQIPVWLLFDIGRGRVISHEEILDKPGDYPVYSSQTENQGIMGYLSSFEFEGDFLTWTTDGANAGTVFRRSGRFNCTNVCGTLKLKAPTVSLDYCRHALAISTAYFVRHDINPKLMNNVMAKIRILIPSIDEQSSIAEFLDHETSKIDALIAEQRRLIELLKEKRQAVISHAVTKGLNPNAPMKPSGIDWLGDVPEHWEVKPMRTIANVVRGASPRPAGDPRYFGGDVMPWVTVAEITKDDQVDLTETESFLTEEGAEHSKRFPSGTVIYSNSGATLGVPKILRMDACANDGVVAFERLHHGVHPQFLYHYLASITNAIREKVKQGSGQPNLNTDIVKALQFGVPPLVEQQVIVRHIEQLAKEFDRKVYLPS